MEVDYKLALVAIEIPEDREEAFRFLMSLTAVLTTVVSQEELNRCIKHVKKRMAPTVQ